MNKIQKIGIIGAIGAIVGTTVGAVADVIRIHAEAKAARMQISEDAEKRHVAIQRAEAVMIDRLEHGLYDGVSIDMMMTDLSFEINDQMEK